MGLFADRTKNRELSVSYQVNRQRLRLIFQLGQLRRRRRGAAWLLALASAWLPKVLFLP
jgi:hypothetical protein